MSDEWTDTTDLVIDVLNGTLKMGDRFAAAVRDGDRAEMVIARVKGFKHKLTDSDYWVARPGGGHDVRHGHGAIVKVLAVVEKRSDGGVTTGSPVWYQHPARIVRLAENRPHPPFFTGAQLDEGYRQLAQTYGDDSFTEPVL